MLLIDNFDTRMSMFYKYISEEYADVKIVRNDEMLPEELLAMNPKAVIIASGAGTVKDMGICAEAVRKLDPEIPLLGIGLGAQLIGECFGASFKKISAPARAYNTGFDTYCNLFMGLDQVAACTENITLPVLSEPFPEQLYVTAKDEYGRVISFAHKERSAFGLHVYPSAFADDTGKKIIRNFIDLI